MANNDDFLDFSQWAIGPSQPNTESEAPDFARQAAPTTVEPAKIETPKAPDFSKQAAAPSSKDLGAPDWELPWEREERLSKAAAPKAAPAAPGSIDAIINAAAKNSGIDPSLLRTFAQIESGGRPGVQTGSYKGLFQLSDREFRTNGGSGSIFDPVPNAEAGARKLKAESERFRHQFGRQPTGPELYMIHQQGWGGAQAHWSNPDQPAWQSMYSTAEGRAKGPAWAKRAIWGNVPDDVKRRFGSVENMTSRDFTQMWSDKYAHIGSRFGAAADEAAPETDNPLLKELLTADPDKRRDIIERKIEEIVGGEIPEFAARRRARAEREASTLDFSQFAVEPSAASAAPKAEKDGKSALPFGRPKRDKLFPGEDDFFKKNPHVGGMAAEDGAVIINPYSKLSAKEKEAVALNEAARLYMKNNKFHPQYQLTPEQVAQFKGTPYEKDVQAMRETIAARILSGDPSAKKATPEQKKFVDDYLRPFMDGSKDGIVGGLTDPQQYVEGVKGIAPGAVRMGGTTLKGAASLDPEQAVSANAQRYIDDLKRVPKMSPKELSEFRMRVEKEPAPLTRTSVQSAISDLLDGSDTVDGVVQRFSVTPVDQRTLYKWGQSVTDYAKDMIPAKPGYEQSIGRQLGEGGGTMAAGLPFAFIGPIPGAAFFGVSGSGEAVERAVEWDKRERAAGRPGLTQQQIASSGLMGIAPGATDMLPVETLLGRLPLPVPKPLREALAKGVARIGGKAFLEGLGRVTGQAAVEGGQEAVQSFLQDVIARTYDPTQKLGETIIPEAGMGAGVGGIAQAAKEVGVGIIKSAAGRRGGHVAGDTAPPSDGKLEPQKQIGAEERKLQDQRGQEPSRAKTASEQEIDLLRRQGWADDDIAEMGEEERAAAVEDAKAQQPEGLAEDSPTAEPIRDLKAQAADLRDPKNPRAAVWLPAASLKALERDKAAYDEVTGSGVVVEDFDHQGGMLIARDEETADAALQKYYDDVPVQRIVGELTGSGTGKLPNADTVVQQVTKDGAVVRETAVPADQAEAAAEAFAAPDRDVWVGTLSEALAKRDEAAGEDVKKVGSRGAPVDLQTAEDVAAAGQRVIEPSQKQAEAGNYPKGHVRFQGLEVSIETPKGGTRRGYDESGNQTWEVPDMPAAYGYFKGVPARAKDKEHVDVFIGDDVQSPRAFIIDQYDTRTGEFDEPKVVIGATNRDHATSLYDRSFSDGLGPQRRSFISEVAFDELKNWLQSGDATKPFAQGARAVEDPRIQNLAEYSGQDAQSEQSVLPQLRGEGDQNGPRVGAEFSGVSEGGGTAATPASDLGSQGQQSGVRSGQRPLDQPESASAQYAEEQAFDAQGTDSDPDGVGRGNRSSSVDTPVSAQAGRNDGRSGAVDAPASGATTEGNPLDFSSQAVAPLARYDGEPLSDMEIDAIVDSWRYVQETNRKKRPQSLTQFVIDNGGLVDYAGEVRHIAGSAQERPGLISRNGQDLDDMALRAWESGFLPGDRPTVAAFLDVLDDDLMHGNIVREQDLAALEDFKYADEIAQELADYGVNISRFRSEASLREYFGQERQKPARQVEAGEEAQAAAEVGEGEGGSTAVEDAPYELAQKPEDFDNYVKTGAKPSKSDAKDLGDSPGITTEASGQTSLVPEPTTKDKIAAQTKAKEKKGGNEPMDEGLFGSSKDQLDLVDMAKQPEKETGKVETKADKAETKTNETETKPEADNLPDALRDRLLGEGFATIIEARKFAKDYGFEGSTKDVDELVEQAVVAAAKQIVSETGDVKAAYQAIVDLYNKQPNLAVRTSTSVTNQAYSTPAPLAYLASRLADVANASHVLEPTAGNGMLLIEADPNAVEANEIDPKRAKALRDQNFATVKSVDATDPAFTQAKSADSVIMNPPFGAVREDGQSKSWTVDGLETSAIDHAIALNALHAMTDDGKAVIIMGGVNAESIEERRKGYRGKSKRLFFAKLYKTYNVTDHFTVSGDLYKKQGAGWPVDVVVIEGRGQSERPLPASEPPVILKTWDDLKGKLPDVGTSTKPIRGSQQATDADNRPAGGTDLGKRGSESGDGSGRPNAVGSGTERLPAGTEDKPAGVRADRDRGQPADVSKGVGTEPDSAAQSVRDRRTANERPAPRRERLERTAPPEGSGQALYEPSSSAASLDTLIPVNMAQATKSALSRVEDKHGSLDAFVAEQLGYTDDLSKYFSAEQVDAIAAAIDNIERGSGYILGDQCVGGETLIFDPITGDHTPIQVLTERGEPISVLSLTNDGFAARSATSPFLKGVADLYRVTFDDGSSITVTRGHRFLTSNGWASLDAGVEVGTEIASFSPTGLLLDRAGSIHQACAREDARHSSDKAQDCLSHYSRDLHLCDERSLSAEDSDLVSAPSQGDVLEHTRCYSHRDGQDVSAECIRPRRDIDRHSKNSSSPLESRGPSLISSQEPASSEQLSAQIRQVPSPFDCDSGPLHQEDGASAIGQLAEKDRRLSSFSSTNNTAYRRVVAIQFDRHDAFFDMHVPGAFNYVANGVVNHNTGIGKGRVVAATIRYAIRKGWTPVFVTEKPDLYGDMFRDMADIGLRKMLGHEPRALMTNTGESVPLDEEALAWKQEADQARADGQPIPKRRGRFLTAGGKPAQEKAMQAMASGKGQHDIVFTTYDQMNTIKKQETDRRRFLRQIMPNSLLILDESHNAGGQGEKRFKAKHGDAPDRAEYVRGLVKDAAGVVYSSATFAKRPDVMDLYARTDMGKAVDDPKMLPALIQKGGVPMQQIVASMLSNAGQYMRRERSFEGVEYAVEPVPVDEKTYKQFSDAVRAVFEFDLAVEDIRDKVMEDILDKMGATKAKDAGVGGGSANSIAFAAIMHNIVNQMLLSIKARQVAQRAIDAHKAGEKPVIALAGTMESFISDYAEDAGISIGQPIAISFGDVLQRYLSRTLRITVKDSDNQKKHVQIPISDLPPSLQRKYAEAEQLIKEGDFDSMPVSPIDAIRHELTSAGLSVAEVTGRKVMIDYGAKGNSAVLIDRPKSEIGPSGKRSSIAAFNRGGLDALILNRSGSTGVSMHASKAFKDQSPRRMIIAQAEANIDTHCLDAKTEILTPDGFKGIDDAFDTVAAIDPVSGAVAWRPVTGRVKRALGADETMFGIQSPGLDIRVTNNHRMLMKHRRQSVGWRFETAEDIGRRRSNWRLPVSGVQIPEKSLNLTDHELRFIGWVLTDGSINYKSRQIVIWQAEHQPYHDDIRACIEGCGFKYGVTENRGKTQHVRNSRSIGYVISLGQWRHLKEYLDKDFPIAFEHLDRRQLSVLLEALHLGDGTKFNNQPWTRRSYHIASGRKTFADRLQSLCIRRGYRCNVSEMNYNLNPLYMVRIKDKNEQSVGGPTQDDGRPTFGPVSFDAGETVWCVENELGTLITRRNGKVAFVGNCQMLGRVHRTGQVRTPSYTQIAAEIPAEARPTAVLMKKMASLNANTTGARGSVFMADSIDFMNDVGDKVVANIIQDEPEINAKLGNPLKENVKGLPVSEDAARRVTGRLVLLTPKEQTELLNRIQDEYKAEIERLDALGENALEAKTVDLKARHIETTALKDRTGEGPFLDSAQIEKVSIKSQGRAMAPKEVAEKISEALEITTPEGEGAAQLAVLERSGREWMNKKIGDVRSRSQSWIASDVASKSDDAKVTTKKRHDDQLARWIQTAQVVAPGARVTLQLGDRQMHAIVLSVARTGKAKNPVALGAWTATMAVPDSVRTLTLPFSQLFPPSQVKGSEESGAEVRFSQVPFTGLISQLEDARREDREDRYIVTGNILAGYEQVRGKGRIVNFTMKDGSLRPGVLMGRDFELDKFLERRAVRFRSADQVVTFMTRAPGAQVRSIDKFVTLSRTGSGWQIDMPSGRATGGRYFTDKRVRDAISPDDFSRVGGVMGVRLYDVQKFKAAVEAMLKIGAMFETTEDQEIAQEVIRDGKPPMPKSEPVQSGKAQSETARAISDFAKGVADLKQRTGVQTRQRGDNEPLAAVTGRALEKLTTPSMKAEVAKTQGVSAAYRADGMFFSQSEVGGAVDLRDQIEKAVAAGESFDVPHWHVQDQMEAIRPNLHMFPAGTITGVLHRIDPIDAENVKLHFRTPDGKNKTMGYPLKEIGQSRALALPSRFLGRPIFFAINITIGKQTANAVSGEVWHEAFHILRREGYIRGDRWARLLRHAKKLRVFDMAFRDVLGKIKDPTAQWAPDGITLRQVYAKLYHGRDDHVEVMHQEEITHMIELWHHGALTDADVAPVMDILNDMGSGKIAGNQTTSQTDMDRILFGEGYFAASGPAASIGQWLDWAENLGDKQIQIKDRNGKAYTIERVGRFGSITYTVMDGRKTVGSFYVRTGGAVPGTISVMNALIERGYQRRGLASAVYDAIEADTAAGGRPLYPQGRYSLSEDGRAFWQARDPAKLAEMDRVDSEPGYAYGQAVRVALDRPAQTKLKTEISEAIAIVQRIAGNGVHIDFKSQIPARAARQAVADVEAFRAAGRAGDFIGGFYRPEMAHLEALIGLSVEAPGFDLRTAAGHEAWHHVERVFATDAELRVLYSPAEQARMRKLVAVELGLDPDNSRRDAALLAVMPQVEVTAYAFQRYRRLREEGMASMNGLHIAVRRLFERVYKIFQNIKGVVTSEGLTYETIFETARTGAMAKRQRRDRRSHGRVAASGVGNLDMSPEARKARAEEMGFDTSKVWYHSSLSPIEAFEPHGKFMGRWGVSGISLTNNPKMASRYLDRYGDVNYKGVPFQKNVMPLYVKRGLRIKEITTPIKQKLGLGFPLPEGYKWPKELDGYDGILVRDAINGQDVVEGSDAALLRDLELDDFEGKVFHTDETDPGAIAGYELILRDPSNIRSVNAAFDPALYDSASLLAQSLPSIEAIIQSVVDKAANTNTNIATHAALFVDQYLTFDEGQSTTSGEMYDAYKIWAKNANVEAGDEQAFHRAMISHGGMSRMRIAGRTRYLGVRIASKLGRKVADANALMPVEKRTLAQDIAQGFSFSAALSRVIDAMKAKVGGSAASAETVKQIADVNRLIAVQDQIVSENDNDVDRVVADNIYAMFDNPDILAAAIPSSPGVARPMSWLERRARRMFARLGERGDAIRVRLQDKALPIKRLAVERVEAETGTSVPPSLDTYLKEALYSGRAGERMIDLEQDQIEPLIEHMRNEGISLDDLGDYLYARHARERNAWIAMINDELPDGGSGMTNAEADQTLADVRASGKQAAMDEAARRIDKMIENTRKDLLKAGLIDRETFDNWSQKYAAYVPLRGFDIGEDENPDFPRVGRGYDVRGREAFAALGRRSKADNPVIYAVQQAQQAIVRAEKNRVNKTLYNAVKSYPNESFWKIYNGELRRRLNPSTGLVEEYWVPPQFVRRDDVIGVKLNGKQKWIELKHPALARSLRGVGSDVSGSAIGRVAHKVMRTYAGLLTSYNPEFVASNFFRDVQTAIINATGLQNKPAGMRRKIAKDAVSAAAIRGALAAIRNHEGRTIFGGRRAADETILGTKRSSTAERYARYYDEFRRAGGKVSFIEFNDVERIRNKTLSALKAGRVRRGLRLAAESVEHLNTAVENGVRLSTYVTLREAGVSQDEAAFAAKELTVNFNRKGEWGPGINALYLFFNASVQGITRMARAITTSSKVRYALGGLLAFGAMLDMLNYLAAGDDDDGENRYDKIPHWVKERNLIIMNPLGDGNYLMIPLPYGYNTPFLAGQEAMSVIRGVSKPEEAAGRVLLATLEAFNPMGSAGSFLQYASPTLLDPAVQIMENRNWFGGRIMPKKFDDREPDSQAYFDSAPGWAKEVARILNEKSGGNIGRPGWADFSPETIEHWAEFAGGGTATFFFNAIATAERFVDGEEWLPEKAPMVRRLYGRQDSSVSRKREFYDAWSDVNQVHYEIKELMKSGDREAAITARDTYKPEVQAYNAMKGAQKQLKALRAARGAIETRTDLDAATKRERLDDITAKEKRVVMRSLKVYEDAKKAAGR